MKLRREYNKRKSFLGFGLLALTGIIIQTGLSQDVWIKKDDANGPPRGAAASFSLDGEAFVVGGVDVEEFKRKTYSYDLEQDDWDNENPLGGEAGLGLSRASAVGFEAGGYGFVALGKGASAYLKDLWQYDPESGAWTQMADFIGTGRSGAVGFSVDDVAYVGSGQDEDGLQDDFYKYTQSTNTWEAINDFEGGKRKEAVGFTMGGKGYMGTGRGTDGYFVDFWEYNPLTDNWTQKADFPGTPRMGAVGCGVFPTAFIMMGEDNDFEYKDDVWEYNYFGNVWTQRADFMGGTRTQASAIVVQNRIFVGLGYNGIYHDDFYEYDRIVSLKEYPTAAFSVYPNPTRANCRIQFNQSLQDPIIRFYGPDGKDVTSNFDLTPAAEDTFVQLKNSIPPGTYFAVIYDAGTEVGLQKIIFNP